MFNTRFKQQYSVIRIASTDQMIFDLFDHVANAISFGQFYQTQKFAGRNIKVVRSQVRTVDDLLKELRFAVSHLEYVVHFRFGEQHLVEDWRDDREDDPVSTISMTTPPSFSTPATTRTGSVGAE